MSSPYECGHRRRAIIRVVPPLQLTIPWSVASGMRARQIFAASDNLVPFGILLEHFPTTLCAISRVILIA